MMTRRKILTALAGLFAVSFSGRQMAQTGDTHKEEQDVGELRFPGDPTDHNAIYQLNKSSEIYHDAVLFSVGEMLRKYNDNVTIVVTCFGPGIHLVGKMPGRPVSKKNQQRVKSLSDYGVKFHACGNTLDSLGWTKDDIFDFVEIVQVGAADLLEYQEKGFGYISL